MALASVETMDSERLKSGRYIHVVGFKYCYSGLFYKYLNHYQILMQFQSNQIPVKYFPY